MNQGSRLQRLAGLLVGEPLGGQPAQFLVDQRQELVGRFPVTPLDGRIAARGSVPVFASPDPQRRPQATKRRKGPWLVGLGNDPVSNPERL